MPRSPSRPAPPSGYIGAMRNQPYPGSSTHDRYSPYPHPHHPSHRPQYSPRSHPHVYHHFDHDPYYRSPRGGESYHYAGPDAVSHHKAEYPSSSHYPPPPHPPAPPAPPRVHQTRQVHPYHGHGLPDPRSPPFVKYYRAPVEYDSRYVPPRPNSSWHMAEPERLPYHEDDVHDVPSSQSYPEAGYHAPSEGPGSRAGSEVPEKTPSPVDPEGIRRWEQQHCEVQSQHASCASGSHCEDEVINDGAEQPVIDPTLTHPPQSSHSPPLNENDAHDSATVDTDKVSPDEIASEDSGTESEDAGIEMPNSKKRPNAKYYPSLHHQVQFAALAKQSKKTRRKRIGLNSLLDGESDDRPSYPLPTIIKCAISGSPHGRLTLSELYTAMEERFPFYKASDKKSWRNSVRHNLSLNNQFVKEPRPMTEPGKGHYWVVVPNMPQGNKRERKRNKKPGKRALAAEAARLAREQELSASVSSSTGSDQNDSNNDRSQEADADIPIDPQLVGVTTGYLAPMQVGHVTVPANAGSYAAVTGAIPLPALDTQLFCPWRGGGPSSSSSTHDASQPVTSALTAQEPAGNASQQTISSNQSKEQPPESSLLPVASISPRHPSKLPSNFQGSGSTKDTSSHGGAQRSVKGRVDRRYNPTVAAPTPSAPRNAFEALAAQIEHEGIGASGSGGPASRIPKRQPGRGIRSDIDSDSESDCDGDLSGDEDHLRNRTRRQ